ncbi:hypothetical protein DCO56_14355 [Sphingobacterium athyrii]|uniref:Uncharacterized protein n=1 Tax=Sphingobacterium athyrii TaxID=2152717 RepID=A0A363NUV2_9SPHI|nr:hypothetical protein DCO56_14355 [Sphingobacterium athyrii]
METLNALNRYVLDRQFIKVNYIEDLNTKIYYFKNIPFIMLDYSQRKICFFGREPDFNLAGLQDQICRHNYLPKYDWFAINANKPELESLKRLINDCYLNIYNKLLRNL